MTSRGLPFVFKLVISIFLVVALGGAGGIVTSHSVGTWYTQLVRPPGTPPNWIFGPVWTVLYILIGISFALVWHRGLKDREGRIALGLFLVQMALNLAWTPVFFGLHQLFVALVVIVLLWAAILATILAFVKRSQTAAALLVPYFLWVSYATWLNAGFWYLNR